MDLLYKSDWEETKKRYEAWWNHEAIGRCAIWVTAPRDGVPEEEPPPMPKQKNVRWFDFNYLYAINEFAWRHTFYGGEAFPAFHPGYPGWGWMATYLGCPITLDDTTDTGWVEPIINQGTLTDYDYRRLVIDSQNHWWKINLKLLHFAAEVCKGKAIVGVGAFGGCGDALAALRGTEQLLLDLVNCPDYVREFDQYLMRQWCEVYDTFYEIIQPSASGSTCWYQLWSPGKFYASQNDFAYMISPKMFREIFLSSIEIQTNFLDHTVYHVDGVGNFAHVDALCELLRLQALQILPGAGKPSALHYLEILKKVQAKGKNLWIVLNINEVEFALRELSARGLFIHISGCKSEAEAKVLLKSCEKWSHD